MYTEIIITTESMLDAVVRAAYKTGQADILNERDGEELIVSQFFEKLEEYDLRRRLFGNILMPTATPVITKQGELII